MYSVSPLYFSHHYMHTELATVVYLSNFPRSRFPTDGFTIFFVAGFLYINIGEGRRVETKGRKSDR